MKYTEALAIKERGRMKQPVSAELLAEAEQVVLDTRARESERLREETAERIVSSRL